jgi:hypothetical protein
MVIHIHITVRVIDKAGRGKGKSKKPDFSTVPKQLQQQIDSCKNLSELHALFFATGRKSKAVMDAFIDRREILQFDLSLSAQNNSSPQNYNYNGSY